MVRKAKNLPREESRMFGRKRWIIFSAILVLIIVLGFVFSSVFLQPETRFSLTAAIIDQLGEEFPNSTFVESATNILKSRGFNVTYYNETLTVNFFKGLAKYNYGIIIFRAHSALREDNSTVDLFTAEKYDNSKYGWERENGLLTKGELLYVPGTYYFAVTPLFIKNLEDRFSKSIVIAMGCWSLKTGCEQMAMAFIDKGAKAYVGWTELVLAKDTDHETAKLLDAFLVKNKTLSAAIETTAPHTYYGDGKKITSRMDFYPRSPSVGDLEISDLIAEAKASYTTSAFHNLGDIIFALGANASLNRRIFIQRNKRSINQDIVPLNND